MGGILHYHFDDIILSIAQPAVRTQRAIAQPSYNCYYKLISQLLFDFFHFFT